MTVLQCPRCATRIEMPAHGHPVCPNCGFGAPASVAASPMVRPAAPQRMAPRPTPRPTGRSMPPSPPAPTPTWNRAGPSVTTYGPPASNGMATASLVLGILGFLPFCALLAIILGFVARSRISKEPSLPGDGKALAGIILGFVWIALSVVFLLSDPTLLEGN